MKIGIVVTDLFQLGGVERVVLLLSRIFCDILGHEVTIFSCLSSSGAGKLFFECPDQVKIVHLSENLDPDSRLVKNSFFTENFSQVPGFVGVEKISEKSSARYTDFHRMLVQLFCAVFCAQCQNDRL